MDHGRYWRTIAGTALLLLGILLLLSALNIIRSSAAWGIFWAIMLISLGLFLIRGHLHFRSNVSGQSRAAAGEVRVGDMDWDLKDMETGLGAGQFRLDLTKARIPSGETRIKIKVGVGQAEVLVPVGLAVTVRGEVGVGSIKIFGEKAEGLGRQSTYVTPDYAAAEKKVRIDISLMVGEALVYRAG
ncbi:MAG: cell wall-active antibiotics response protein [Chloroflexi bacterium]|nr:cell wall-active antibiotics response protein [Chloroflexota bacterium]